MTWLWVVLGIVAVLLLLAQVRVRVSVAYDSKGFFCWGGLGAVWLRLYPRKKRGKKSPKPQKTKTPKKELDKPDMLALLREGLPILLDTAGRFRRKLRIDQLRLSLVVGASDPAKAAIRYGNINAALGILLPILEGALSIKERQIHTSLDFQGQSCQAEFVLDGSLTIGQGLVLGLVALKKAWPLLSKDKPNKEQKEGI